MNTEKEILEKGKEIKVLDKGFVRYIDHMGSDERIVEAARISYKSPSKGAEQDKKLLKYLYKNKHCYHPDMEVLTTRGWLKWSECGEYEHYLIPDPTTGELRIEVLKLLTFDVEDEKMYGFENQRMSYLVTGNHKMWFKPKNGKLSDNFTLIDADKVSKWGHFETGGKYSLNCKESPDDRFKLIGFYLGDGFAYSNNTISFRLCKERKLKYLESILFNLNVDYTKVENGVTSIGTVIYQYKINIDQIEYISEYIDVSLKSHDKCFDTNKLSDVGHSQKLGLLDGLINSDGSVKRDREQIEFSSSSHKLTKLVETLANFFEYDCHHVTGFDDFKVKLYNVNGRTSLEARKEYFYNKMYSGKVYCTTSSNGLLLVRGKNSEFSFVCGNSSPFEMCKLTLNIKMPIFIMRQYVRHRMQNLNEVSARYTQLSDDFYIPEKWRKQDNKNKQGSLLDDSWEPRIDALGQAGVGHTDCSDVFEDQCKEIYKVYQSMIDSGIAREMARMILPLNIYTEIYSCWDLKNLIHFIALRDDSHAQYEIQQYGKAIKSICEELFPVTMEAYEEFKS